jgi:delta24-sterol reductase
MTIFSIQEQVRSAPKGVQMCTARAPWLAMSLKEGIYKNHMARIDVSDLDNVLEVDEEAQIVFVEPNCNMGQITRELIPRGWTLAVVPELDDLTVGGLIMGFGIEVNFFFMKKQPYIN